MYVGPGSQKSGNESQPMLRPLFLIRSGEIYIRETESWNMNTIKKIPIAFGACHCWRAVAPWVGLLLVGCAVIPRLPSSHLTESALTRQQCRGLPKYSAVEDAFCHVKSGSSRNGHAEKGHDKRARTREQAEWDCTCSERKARGCKDAKGP